jgi:uncharacterized membrane protein
MLNISPRRNYWLLFLIVILLLGIFFRLFNINGKVYWHDEAYTSLRISGYTKAEFVQQVFDGQIVGVNSIHKYQRPNSEKGVIGTMKALAVDDSQHPPLYYVMVRLWVQIFGNSITATRSLSAIISLLAFPCLYLLCLELFDSPRIALTSLVILAVSPLHILYAQEARQFSLWTVTILLESAVLLRAIRLRSQLWWKIYGVTVALGLYTFLFSGLVAIAHGIYVIAIERFRFNKTVKAYLTATSTGLIAFIPWIVVVINNLEQIDQTTASAQTRLSILSLVSAWLTNITYVFGDFWRYEPFFTDLNFPVLRLGRFLTPVILILVIYSFLFVYRKASLRVWLFIFILSGITGLSLIFSDVIIGGKLSFRPRYFMPSYMGIQLAVSYLLATQIMSANLIARKFCQMMIVILVCTGVLSCSVSSHAETWWNKGSHANPQIARIINKTDKPLLISSNNSLNIGDLMSLSHLLSEKVQIQLVIEPKMPQIPKGFSHIFLYNPSKVFQSKLEKKYKLNLADKRGRLWQIENKTD